MTMNPSDRPPTPPPSSVAAPAKSPAVAAIVVAGPRWTDTEAVLTALAGQDYPRLAVLVMSGTDQLQRRRIADVIPDAAVTDIARSDLSGHRRVRRSAAVNRASTLVRGADYLLLVGDGVALAPDAISMLVADIANAPGRVVGAAGPKLIDADDGVTLRDLGGTADRQAVRTPVASEGELDQSQHDEPRDLFVAPTGAMLVRADLFAAVGGFDPALEGDGAAVDLCWRIQLAGGRIRVVPAATGMQRTLPPRTSGGPTDRQHEHRARLRTMLKCYGWVHLLPALFVAVIVAVGEIVVSAARGRFAQASDVLLAWLWNVRQLPNTLALRGAAKRYRRVRDADLRRLQQGGSVRLADWLRYRLSPEGGLAARTRVDESILGTWRRNAHRTVWVVWGLVLAVIAFGSRHLLTGGIPVFGQFAPFADVGSMLGAYADGWRDAGVGSAGIGAPALGLLSLGGIVLLGAVDLLRAVAVWGLLLAGLSGMWRLCAPLGSRNGRLVALVLYAACPLPYNALAAGRWDVLLAYGTSPLILLLVGRLIGAVPTDRRVPGDGSRRAMPARAGALALLLAIAAAFEPYIVVLALGAAVVLTVAELLRVAAGGPQARTPLLGLLLVVIAAGVAVVAHLPWLAEFDSIRDYIDASLGSPTTQTPTALTELLSFQTGPLGSVPLGWGIVAAAAVPLLLARSARLWWSVRGWAVALAGFAAAWAIVAGWVDNLAGFGRVGHSLAEVSLAMAAAGLCWAAAAGPAALSAPSNDASPRWRSAMVLVTGIAVGAMVVPAAWASVDGDWSAPRFDHQVPLSLVDDRDVGPDYRVLWLGAPEVLPARGVHLGVDGLAAATSIRGYPDVRHRWVVPSSPGNERLLSAIRVGLDGETLRLGRLLASFGIRYVVVVERSGPSYATGWEHPLPPALHEALASQIDLRPLAADPSVLVFRNEAWWSTRAQFDEPLPPGFAENPVDLVVSDRSDGVGVLTDYRSVTFQRGPVGAGPVLVAESFDPGWVLEIDGNQVEPSPALGWAMRFDSPIAGTAELYYERSDADTNRIWAQILIWLAIVWVAIGQPTPFADRIGAAARRMTGSSRTRRADAS